MNPRPDSPNLQQQLELGQAGELAAAFWQYLGDTSSRVPSSIDADLIKVARCWTNLPAHVRETIVTLATSVLGTTSHPHLVPKSAAVEVEEQNSAAIEDLLKSDNRKEGR